MHLSERVIPYAFRQDVDNSKRNLLKRAVAIPVLIAITPLLTSQTEAVPPDLAPFLEALKRCKVDRSAHNAANIDEDQYSKEPDRFERFLDSDVDTVEIDGVWIDGAVYGGHSANTLRPIIYRDKKLREQQRAENLITRAVDHGKNINFDAKPSLCTEEGLDATHALLKTVPERIRIKTSGLDWNWLEKLNRKLDRPVITLLTVNGGGLNTWATFDAHIKDLKSRDTSLSSMLGVSAKLDVLTRFQLWRLTQERRYVLGYEFKTPQDVIKYAGWGITGITSDSKELLEATGQS